MSTPQLVGAPGLWGTSVRPMPCPAKRSRRDSTAPARPAHPAPPPAPPFPRRNRAEQTHQEARPHVPGSRRCGAPAARMKQSSPPRPVAPSRSTDSFHSQPSAARHARLEPAARRHALARDPRRLPRTPARPTPSSSQYAARATRARCGRYPASRRTATARSTRPDRHDATRAADSLKSVRVSSSLS